MKKYSVAIVGVGAVGVELVRMLHIRGFPFSSITLLARTERSIQINENTYDVKVATPKSFDGVDIVFFAGTEGEKGASQLFWKDAVTRGCLVIDNGDDFRMDNGVPLVIPEINPHTVTRDTKFIANPNCSTIIALMALAPLHRVSPIRRVVASTYQAVSGAGAPGVTELEDQTRAWYEGEVRSVSVFPHVIHDNVIPAIGSYNPNTGSFSEEEKIVREARKILGDTTLSVSATCVRVPVAIGHSMALNVEFTNPMTPNQARGILSQEQGVKVSDRPEVHDYPMPSSMEYNVSVQVGRIRADESVTYGLNMFVSGNNLWKGAAQNAVQIAELAIAVR